MSPRRVLMIGSPGAGKTTLARKLAQAWQLPLIHLDTEYWQPGWKEPSRAEWRSRVAELVQGERWLMDGNYTETFDLRLPRADTLVWIEAPRLRCLARVVRRTLSHYGRSRAELAGCPERFEFAFLRYVWRFPQHIEPRLQDALARFGAHLRLIHVRNAGDAAALLSSASHAAV